MLHEERQAQILQLLNERKTISVHDLCSILLVSGATIRRDLAAMEKAGVLKRSHGGAMLLQSTAEESAPITYEQQILKEKRMIGELASTLIRPNTTLFIDASATCGALIPFLKQYNYLTVITNGLKNALLLSQNTTAKIYLTGGNINADICTGSDAISYIKDFYADFAICSCDGANPESGFTDTSFEKAAVKKAMLAHAKTKILLCDHRKLDAVFFCHVCGFEDIDYFVTDQPTEYEELLSNTNCTFLYPQK